MKFRSLTLVICVFALGAASCSKEAPSAGKAAPAQTQAKAAHASADVKPVMAGKKAIKKLFSKEQRAYFAAHAPEGIELDDLSVLGPINVFKLKFAPKKFGYRLVAELWNYPDGSRILELSTKCLPDRAFQVAAEARAFLSDKGIDLGAEQQTKTATALKFFAEELAN